MILKNCSFNSSLVEQEIVSERRDFSHFKLEEIGDNAIVKQS